MARGMLLGSQADVCSDYIEFWRGRSRGLEEIVARIGCCLRSVIEVWAPSQARASNQVGEDGASKRMGVRGTSKRMGVRGWLWSSSELVSDAMGPRLRGADLDLIACRSRECGRRSA